MAIFFDARNKRTKCSGIGKGLQSRLWIWCILLVCFISLPCISSKCLNVDITVAVSPEGDITVPYGSPLEIFCFAENLYTSNDIDFTFGGKILPSDVVNSTTRRLYIEKPEKQSSVYYCKNKKTHKICLNRILIDSPPANVTDFSCLSKNLDILNCSWTAPELYTTTNFKLTFTVNGHSVQPCSAEKVEKTATRYCQWNTTSQPRYRQQEDEFFFNLTSCNIFGCIEQHFRIDHFSIVKPDPPSDLKVLSNGTHSVLLQWSIPNNMVDLLPCGVDHRIEYQIAKIDNTSHFRPVVATNLPRNNKTYRFQLTDLPYAHMQYEVRVYIKSKKADNNDLWSDFSYVVFYTASERPKKPPEITAGAFDQSAYNDARVIYIYWKQLEECEEAGANFTYKVLVKQEGSRSKTYFPDKNKSLSYVVLNEAPLGAMEVFVWSSNTNGTSVNNSYLYIPPKKETHSLSLAAFTKLAYENGTYELSWDGIDNIDNYTIFWCQHNSTKICVGRMNFTVLEPHRNNYVIDLPRHYRYQFAIAANKGLSTSGMVWAKCDISKDGIAMYSFPVKLYYDKPGKTFVKIRWTMDCALKDGIIIGYNITYCPIIRTSSWCDDKVGNLSAYVADPKQMEVNITGLLPYRTYQFTISLNTIHGLKTIENTSTEVTTTEDTPTSPRNVVISDIRNDSLVISWDPPEHKNGNIGKYVIYNNKEKFYVDKLSTTDGNSRRQVTLTGLYGFTNYSWSVQACNIPIDLCSVIHSNETITMRTRFGPPSKLKAPVLINGPDGLIWNPPTIPGGTVDRYQVKIVKDGNDFEIHNTTNLSFSTTFCEGVSVAETYQVRALNFDEDMNHGAKIIVGNDRNIILPKRDKKNVMNVYEGDWSEPSSVNCRGKEGLTAILVFMVIFALAGIGYGMFKLYKNYRKMEDIKPVLPNGLGIPEKDISKYAFGGWNPSNKDEKPSSDEMLLLPSGKTSVPTPDIKLKDNDNCDISDETDSTALSDACRAAMDQQASTSENGSNTSVHLEVERVKPDHEEIQVEEPSTSETESSQEGSPYFNDKSLNKNSANGYVQPVVNPNTGYKTLALPKNPPLKTALQPSGTSYVMAGLSPSIFTTDVKPPTISNNPPPSSGYVRPEDAQSKSMNFPKLGPSPTKVFGPESLPTMPLPKSKKPSADSSYIQLQSLNTLPSLKPTFRNTVPLKPPASSGYVSPGDAVINKHLNNMLSPGQLAEESAILDPSMSPDAYCRFSWNTDPANDNLHSLLADSPTVKSSKN